jgi:hypothetical protein
MQYTPFNLTRDINGYNGFGLPFSIDNFSANLATNTDTTQTVPSHAPSYLAVFSYQQGASVWVAVNATAAKPVGATFAAVTSTLNPSARYVKAADVLHFLTGDTSAQVSITLYALPNG